MSRHGFSVAYDGEDAEHVINVETLAPALLAFGKLIREANTEFNGKRATSHVVVVSDFERKCFNINFDVILNFYEQIKTLVGSSDAVTAQNILEWLGFIAKGTTIATGSGTLSYLAYLRWKRGRKVTDTGLLKDADKSGVVEVHVEGDGNSVHVHNHVYQLSENPKALRATRDTLLPLGQNGYDTMRVKEGENIQFEISNEDVENIIASCTTGIEQAKETEPEVEVTSAWLSVYSPVFDLSAHQWRFKLGKDVIYADISETTIAADAMARGGASIEDAYQVRLEITTEIDAKGAKKDPKYKILSVVRFVSGQPAIQQSLFQPRDPN